ncbi:UNVERIFIED_CONTAM: hypothetical protein FKN15_019141 [Acipenser sinensis]
MAEVTQHEIELFGKASANISYATRAKRPYGPLKWRKLMLSVLRGGQLTT